MCILIVYIILYGDHFSRIPLYTYISFNGPLYRQPNANNGTLEDGGGGGGGVGGGGGGGVVGVAGVDVKVELIEQDYRVTERGKSQIC